MSQKKQTIQEVLQKEVFTIKDISVIFQVKEKAAGEIIQNIKMISDRLGLESRVHKKDYEDYVNRL